MVVVGYFIWLYLFTLYGCSSLLYMVVVGYFIWL